jgi:hypothetical protein
MDNNLEGELSKMIPSNLTKWYNKDYGLLQIKILI